MSLRVLSPLTATTSRDHFLVRHLLTYLISEFYLAIIIILYTVGMAEPRAKRARFSARDVIGMLESGHDDGLEESDSDSGDDYNDDEVVCAGSDDEFFNFDKEEVPPQDFDFSSTASLPEEREET